MSQQTTRKGDWIQSYSGRRLWPLACQPEDLYLVDIAHSLALKCRFGGHCNTFYSVAQHSVLVSQHVPRELAAWGLLHDAAEALIGDITRPLKRCLDLREVEEDILRAVAARFDLPPYATVADDIGIIDNRMLATEKRRLMVDGPVWSQEAEPLPIIIDPLPWQRAKLWFLETAERLGIA